MVGIAAPELPRGDGCVVGYPRDGSACAEVGYGL